MSLTESPKIVFPHVMKTAGTSVIAWLQRHYADEQVLWDASVWPELWNLAPERLDAARLVRGHFGSSITERFGRHNGYAPIVLLRDPLERTLSHFFHLKFAEDADPRFHFVRSDGYSLTDFLADPRTECFASNYQCRNLGHAGEPRALTEADGPPEVGELDVSRSMSFLADCEVVGTTENLPGFVSTLSNRFGFYADTGLGITRSYRRPQAIAQHDIDRIRELNALDAELHEAAARRAERDGLAAMASEAVNPVGPQPDGRVRWNAASPFWGQGWSDRMRGDPVHVWSTSHASELVVAAAPRTRYLLVLDLFRFVHPDQQKGFQVSVNGSGISTELVSRTPNSLVFVGQFQTGDECALRIGLQLSRLVAFREVNPSDPSETPLGLALHGLRLIPCNE